MLAGEGVEIRLPGGALLKTVGFDQLRPLTAMPAVSSSRTPRRLSIAAAICDGSGL